MSLLTLSAVIIMIFGLVIFVRAWINGSQSMKSFDKQEKEQDSDK